MEFKKYGVYTHENMLDMVIYVQQILWVNDKYAKLKVKWFNRRSMDINLEEQVKILKSEFCRWHEWDILAGEII